MFFTAFGLVSAGYSRAQQIRSLANVRCIDRRHRHFMRRTVVDIRPNRRLHAKIIPQFGKLTDHPPLRVERISRPHCPTLFLVDPDASIRVASTLVPLDR